MDSLLLGDWLWCLVGLGACVLLGFALCVEAYLTVSAVERCLTEIRKGA